VLKECKIMRTRCLLLLLLGLGLGLLAGLPTTAAEKADAEKIAQLIEQMGSKSFTQREKAMQALDQIGAPALEALRKAAKSSDPEISHRAAELVKKIEQQNQGERILAPSRIRLVYKDTPVPEAVADLAKKTGYNIVLQGDQSKLAQRKITLDTGETTFWKAFDQFCEKAGLVETNFQGGPFPPGGPLPPIRRSVPFQPAPVPAPLPAPGAAPGAAAAGAAAPAFQAVAAPAPAAAPGPAVAKIRPVPYPGGFGQIMLMDGKPQHQPTCYAGSVRIRALPPSTQVQSFPKREGEILFALEAFPEPKLQVLKVLGVRVDKALDDQGQNLSAAMTVGEGPGPVGGIGVARSMIARPVFFGAGRQVPIRLKKGDKESKSLKELKGAIEAQVRTPAEPLMTVDDVLKSAGKTVKCAEGGRLKVQEASRDDSGQIKLRVELEIPVNIQPAVGPVGGFGVGAAGVGVAVPGGVIQVQPAQIVPGAKVQQKGQVQIQIAPAPPAVRPAPAFIGSIAGMTLYDTKGQPIQMVPTQGQARGDGKTITWEYTVTCQPEKGQEVSKLVFAATRMVTIDIPFELKDVTLP
jgi:hypothetical protein